MISNAANPSAARSRWVDWPRQQPHVQVRNVPFSTMLSWGASNARCGSNVGSSCCRCICACICACCCACICACCCAYCCAISTACCCSFSFLLGCCGTPHRVNNVREQACERAVPDMSVEEPTTVATVHTVAAHGARAGVKTITANQPTNNQPTTNQQPTEFLSPQVSQTHGRSGLGLCLSLGR